MDWAKKALALAAILAGVSTLLLGIGEACIGAACVLKDVAVCALEAIGVGNMAGVGTCFTSYDACQTHFGEAALKIAAGAAVFTPGLASMKVGVFARTDQKPTQAKATPPLSAVLPTKKA